MDTHLTTSPEEAAVFIRRGQLVAFPTETVYGLGADSFNEEAVQAIFQAKGRPNDNPLIVHIARRKELRRLVKQVPKIAQQLVDRFFPGPLTLILPRRPEVPAVVSGGLDTIGVRMPRHPVAQAFLSVCATPVAAPSANRSGRPSPTSWQAVEEDLGGHIACILQGDRTEVGLESTVVDCTEAPPTVLRAGAISVEALQEIFPDIRMESSEAPERRRSPGTRYRHYAPTASVVLTHDPEEAQPDARHAYIGLDAPPAPETFGRLRICPNVEDYARELFHFFRESDAAGCTWIYCQAVPCRGIGRALMDRITRAANR